MKLIDYLKEKFKARYFKVLAPDLTSPFVAKNSKYKVQYIENQWVKPILENSGLFVFDSHRQALEALRAVPFGCIYEVEVKNPSYLSLFGLAINSLCDWDIEYYWRRQGKRGWFEEFFGLELDVVAAESVKLVKKVS